MTNKRTTKRSLIFSVLSLLLCCTMLMGTTYAWFTDSVTSDGNIITSGSLDVEMYWAEGNEDLTSAAWKDASQGAIFNSTLWEPGRIEAKHIKIENVGTLAFRYQLRIVANGIISKLADVIDVYYFEGGKQLTRADVATGTYLGTLAEVMGAQKNISATVNGTLKADEDTTLTLALKMQESADNEYQNLSIGSDFSIELIATQTAYENDSFGTDYDNVDSAVPSPEIPAATVKSLGSPSISYTTSFPNGAVAQEPMKLNAAYQFEPTELLDAAEMSQYKHWHADFVVSADQDVPANSVVLAGYYSAFCDDYNNGNWVALTSDVDIAKDTEIRLVQAMGGGSINVTYKDLCQYGNDGKGFQCGIGALDAAAAKALAGTTITVELRMYETESKWDDASHNPTEIGPDAYQTIGTFTYTFPAVAVADQAELDAAIAGGISSLELGAGTYKMPSDQSTTAEYTITGTKDTVIDVTLGAYMDKATVTFKGVTIKTSTGMANGNGSDYAALYTPNVTYIDCTFVGPMRVGRDGAKFIDCTFTALGNDYVWTYGNDVTFEGCTFNTDGKAILIYSDGGNEISQVSVKNCIFNSTKGATAGAIKNQNCAAIEIHNYGNGVNLVTEGNTCDANFSGEWRIKTYESGKPGITVNGTAYTQTALDGTLITVVNNEVQ